MIILPMIMTHDHMGAERERERASLCYASIDISGALIL
jgi:hypothetical protein